MSACGKGHIVLGRKLLITSSAAVLSLGLIGIPAASFADDSGSLTQPTVTQSGGSFTVTLPGVGSLSFSVDPSTHALTGVMVTPADPSVVAGTPVLTDEGVQVLFTTATGNETLEVEVEGEDGVPVVKAEAQGPEDGTEDGGTAVRTDEGNNENENQNENPNENENEPGEDQATPTQPTTASTSGDRSGDGADQGTTTTTTSSPPPSGTPTSTGTSSGSDGGSGNDGSDGSTTSTSGSDGGGDGGSGSGQSSDG
jgi:hypothetical protein